MNLSSRTLTKSETDLLHKGLNFCPTPPPPRKEEIKDDIDAFARRLNLKEYHALDDMEDIIKGPTRQHRPTTLEKLNQNEHRGSYRPSRGPYLNTYVENIRQNIIEELTKKRRFQRNNLNARERAALIRLSNERNIVIKPVDKGGATVILNSEDYVAEALRQLDNTEYYKKVDRDYTKEHEKNIDECVTTLAIKGNIERDIGKLLRPVNSRTPVFYMLPKIHKTKNPGRLVVSSVNSHKEKISAYVDDYLRPLAECLPSYIRDTTDFIKRLRALGKLPRNCLLVTLDVSSLYTNIDTDEGLTIVREELEKSGQNNPSAATITLLLEKVLKLNNFTFRDLNYIKIKGTAMGTRAAPNFANVYMGRFEDQFVYQAHWYEYVLDWIQFIDDIFMIWKGDSNSLEEFINHLNNAAPSINFTHEISKSQVNFLHTTITKNENGDVETDVCQKPTDTHRYLHWTSAHPPHLKRSILYSQALRLRRICSDTNKLRTRITEYAEFFTACGYNRGEVLEQMRRVLLKSQEQCLEMRENKELRNRIPLVTTYNPHTTYTAEIAHRHWGFLKSKERLSRIFAEPPLIAYRRPKNLRDKLVSTKFKEKAEEEDTNGCKPCGRTVCSWCRIIDSSTTFLDSKGERTFKIYLKLDCHSAWVIYMIKCKICNLLYIGKSETKCNNRFNNHRSHIRNSINSCELSEHFLHNRRTHDFKKDVTITLIEQIRKERLELNAKRDLLRRREIFWQLKLNTVQPHGLNKRIG